LLHKSINEILNVCAESMEDKVGTEPFPYLAQVA
jgi:hypothetical protein